VNAGLMLSALGLCAAGLSSPVWAQRPGRVYTAISKDTYVVDGRKLRTETLKAVYVATPCATEKWYLANDNGLGLRMTQIRNGRDTYIVWPNDGTYTHTVRTPEEAAAAARGKAGEAQWGFWFSAPEWRGAKRVRQQRLGGILCDVYRRTWALGGDRFRETLILYPGPDHRTRRSYWYHYEPPIPPRRGSPDIRRSRSMTTFITSDYAGWQVSDTVDESLFRPPAGMTEEPLPGFGPDDPRPVDSLDVVDADFETVVRDLAAKSGAKVTIERAAKPYARVTLKVTHRTPFFGVLADLCWKAGAYLDRTDDGWVISRANRPGGP
jgi:hypothetical protein